jgi:hypothetical protein
MTTSDNAAPLPTLQSVTAQDWAALAERKIFFGHQSVGNNLIRGVEEILAQNPQITLNVNHSRAIGSQPGFYHAEIGRNEFPLEKFNDFAGVVSGGFDESGGIAMVKLCYVDIHKQTDPEQLFAEYQRHVDALKSANPSLTIVHFTLPLTIIENWKGVVRATLTRHATNRERNVVRHRYNELVRATYGDKDPVFDLAQLESTLPDGRTVRFRAGEEHVPLLAQEYTNDGGHLNERGRRFIAEQLLITLARVASTRQNVAVLDQAEGTR